MHHTKIEKRGLRILLKRTWKNGWGSGSEEGHHDEIGGKIQGSWWNVSINGYGCLNLFFSMEGYQYT